MHDEEHGFVADGTDWEIKLDTIWILVSLNRNATIDQVDAWDGTQSFMNRQLSLTDVSEHQKGFNVDDHINYGLNVSIHVDFTDETPYPEAKFHGVGAKFKVD